MILRLGPPLLNNLRRAHASRGAAIASGLSRSAISTGPTPTSLTQRTHPMLYGMRVSHLSGFLPFRGFAIKAYMSEPTFHSVADRTIQRFVDLFDS